MRGLFLSVIIFYLLLKNVNNYSFSGGSVLGQAELKGGNGIIIKFLIGKKYASFESGQKMCAGFYLFEKDILLKKIKPNNQIE